MGSSDVPETQADLTVEQIVDRLRLRSPALVADVYALASRQLDVEDKRETNLNTKAISLLSASGVSVTVTFALGGVLAQRPELLESLAPAGTGWRVLLSTSYAVAVFSGIVAGALAVFALKISAYVTVAEKDVFGDELSTADDAGDPDRYRRYLTAHVWQIYRGNFRRHEHKARRIAYGQRFYLLFLALLIPLGASMARLLITVKPAPQQLAASGQVSPMKSEGKPAEQRPNPPPPKPKPPATGIPTTGERVQGHVPREDLPGSGAPPSKRPK